jgi:hypothetical protein
LFFRVLFFDRTYRRLFFDYFKATYLLFFDRFVIVLFRKNNQGNSGKYCAFYFMLSQVQ